MATLAAAAAAVAAAAATPPQPAISIILRGEGVAPAPEMSGGLTGSARRGGPTPGWASQKSMGHFPGKPGLKLWSGSRLGVYPDGGG